MNDTYFTPLAIAEREADKATTNYVAILRNRNSTDAQLIRAEQKRDAAIAKLNAARAADQDK